MPITVVLDVPPIEAVAERAVATCNAALGPDHCALAAADSTSRWYAVVRVGEERPATLTIDLYDRSLPGDRVASSVLAFDARDLPKERWASAGVVVAALVAARSMPIEKAAAKDAGPKPPPRPLPPIAVQLPPSRALLARAELGLTGGWAQGGGAFRFGALTRGSLAFRELPLFVLASGAYMQRHTGTPDFTWWTGALGLGAHVGGWQHGSAAEIRVEAVLDSVVISASDGTRRDRAQRSRFGSRLGVDLTGPLTNHLAWVAGVEAAALLPRVAVDVSGQTVARLPWFGWGFVSLLRYEFR